MVWLLNMMQGLTTQHTMANIQIVTIIPLEYEGRARETVAKSFPRIISHADDRPEILFPKKAGKDGVVTHRMCEIKFPEELFPQIKEIMKEHYDMGELYWNYQATINTSPDEILRSCCIMEGTFLQLIEKLGLEIINANNSDKL